MVNFMAEYDKVSAQTIGLGARSHKGWEIAVLKRFLAQSNPSGNSTLKVRASHGIT
jgi:hypothetical protein